ncbi:hypothetical protein MVEN_01077900 [Mycena venus]|uniref:F-box domain-containing protein n=1 Tax=Mycena venus TaxID=2733690 RepID=A0A8H6Y611_9AGAR|nr:hypothetical protein MVEN_01077900 [Mycena venus]
MNLASAAAAIPYLEIVPAELWIACWSLCSNPELQSVSMVCKLFRSICLPLLLRDQSLDVAASGSVAYGDWEQRGRQLQQLADRLDRLVEYAPSVRSWKVNIGLAGREGESHPDIQSWHFFDEMYERVLTTFPTTLVLYTLASLMLLEDLILRNCDISPFHGDSRWPPPESLRTLNLHGVGPIFRSIILGFGTGNLVQLVDLSLKELHDFPIFLGFLKRCPQLESLKITALTRTSFLSLNSADPDSVSPEWIPLLRRIAAPSVAFIRMLTPNRPVSDVTVLGPQSESPVYLSAEELMLFLMDIASTSAPLQTLVLPGADPTLACLIFITKRFPYLRELSMVIQETGEPPVERRRVAADRLAWIHDGDDSSLHLSEPFPLFRRNKLPDITSASNIHNILRWVFGGDISLSPQLEVLRLKADVDVREAFSERQHRQIAAAVLSNAN